ncbi:hypothetical protein [Variovorax sp. 278MFTsu5.1]|uniref:hypothetical protein n=1 Tax=Variovorax sp. 278MFTsu5.1 TaxID=3158366 RepID=UPI003AAFFB3E
MSFREFAHVVRIPFTQAGCDNQRHMHNSTLPPPFDPIFYRGNAPELAHLTDQEALHHFQDEGIAKGYPGSPGSERGHLLSFARNEASILEIGPFHAPSVVGENVRYMDVLTTEELIEAVKEAGHHTSNVPQIHYVAPSGGFDMVDRQFSAVFSGHCIEHQPNLIRHFQGVSSVMKDGGRYYIACPDKRYCFDHYIPATGISDILVAYHAQHRFHHPRSFIAQRLHGAHNDADRHWATDHGPQRYQALKSAKNDLFEKLPSDDAYHDVHAWQFTPTSFFRIMTFLYEVGLTDFAVERVYHTRFGTQEFTAVLRKGWESNTQEKTFIEQTSPQERIIALQKAKADSAEEIENLKKAQTMARAEMEQLADDKSKAYREIEDLHFRLNSLLASHSWTVTRPLRRLADLLRGSSARTRV